MCQEKVEGRRTVSVEDTYINDVRMHYDCLLHQPALGGPKRREMFNTYIKFHNKCFTLHKTAVERRLQRDWK